MGKGKWIVQEPEANVIRKQVQMRPQDCGVAFNGMRIYVMSDRKEDADVCGKWLQQQGPPIVPSSEQLIMPSKFDLAITPLQYGKGRRIALGTHSAERVTQFMQWMTAKIGPPPKKEVIWTH